MSRTDHLPGIDRRRRWARRRAPIWFVLGTLTIGLGAAAVALAFIVAAARLWARITDSGTLDDGVLGTAGPAMLVVALPLLALTVAWAVFNGLVGASHKILRDVGARQLGDADGNDTRFRQFANVVEALALGLGVTPPELAVIDDPSPNALSVRWGRHRVIAVTTGLLALSRPQIEAVCAHEMAHLHAVDARWISAAEATLHRARNVGAAVAVLGVLMIGFVFEVTFVGTVFLLGLALVAIGSVASFGISSAQGRIRREADTVADVAAILLARDPGSLGSACAAVAADLRVVRRSSWRAAHAWFALLPDDADDGTSPSRRHATSGAHDDPTAAELRRRAEHAYAEARVPFTWGAVGDVPPGSPLPPPPVVA